MSKSDNYFTRAKFNLDPEVAVALDDLTGYRAGWLMFGELPQRRDGASGVEQARLVGYMEGLDRAAQAIEAARADDPNDSRHVDRPTGPPGDQVAGSERVAEAQEKRAAEEKKAADALARRRRKR